MTTRAPLAPPAATPAARLSPALLVGLVVLALACRFSGVGNGYVNYDDDRLRAEIAAKGPVEIATGIFYFAYKPVYGLWLSLERAAFGDGPLAGHVASWLLFGLAVALAAVLLNALFRSTVVAVVGAALLATHPVHAENVAWWAERKDVLSLVLALGAHLAYRRARARGRGPVPVLAPVLLALAGLAKGTVWSYAGVVVLDELVDPDARGDRRARLVRVLPVVAVGLGGIVLDALVGRAYGPGAAGHDASTGALAAAMASVHVRYVLSLIWPFGLSADYPVDPRGSFADPLAIAGVALAVLAVVGTIAGVVRRRPLLALGCGLWVLGLAPVNNVFPTTSILRADRYLLVPALGAYALLAAGLARLRGAAPVVAVVVVGVLGTLAHLRGPVWKDSETLWSDALVRQPTSAIAAINRGADRAERGRWSDAEADARRGLDSAAALRRPELVLRARILLSTALAARAGLAGDEAATVVNEALGAALKAVDDAAAVARSPWLAGDPSQLRGAARGAVAVALETRARLAGDVREASEDFAGAVKAWKAATNDDPASFAAWRNLGNLLASLGGEARLGEAIDALRHAVALRPDDVDAVGYLVRALFRAGRDAEAKALYDATSARLHAPTALRRVDARLEAEVGDPAEAERKLAALLREDRSDDETRALLHAFRKRRADEAAAKARTSREPADREAALAAYEKTLEVGEGDADVHLGAGDTLLMLGRYHDARLRYGRARRVAGGARWIANLEARAGVLEAATHEAAGDHAAAARVVAELVRLDPPRMDVGFATLDEEIRRLRPAADAVLAEASTDRAAAESVLRAAALLVGGDEGAADALCGEAIARAGATIAPGSPAAAIVDAARLLRAVVRGRQGRPAAIAQARGELDDLLARAPGDALLRFHRLLLDRVEARARRAIADGTGDDAGSHAAREALATVRRQVDELAARADLPWPGPVLLAAELDLEEGANAAALQRLNVAGRRFPEATAVRRGRAAVYQAMVLAGGERTTMLREAQRELVEAKRLDPRDPRTALDLSQMYRLAGDLESAARYALSAASVEPIRGPAARVLAVIFVDQGRKALDQHEWDKAENLATAAQKADPAAGGPYHLLGEIAMERQDLDAAKRAYTAAHEREPADGVFRAALAACCRKRGGAYFLWLQVHPRPKASAGGAAPPAAALADWDEKNLLALRMAVREFEAALALEPDGPDAAADRERIEGLRAQDPATSEVTLGAAQRAFAAGEALAQEGRHAEAILRYQEATRLFTGHFPAWMRIAETALRLGGEQDLLGMQAIQKLRALDADRRYPEIDLYAGEFLVRVWREVARDDKHRDQATAAASQARRALTRYREAVAKLAQPSARDRAGLERCQALLDGLPKGD